MIFALGWEGAQGRAELGLSFYTHPLGACIISGL